MGEQEFSADAIVRGVVKRWWLLLTAPVIAGLAGYFFAQTLPKLYTVEVQFKLDDERGKSSSAIIHSNMFAEKVIADFYAGDPQVSLRAKRKELDSRLRWLVLRSYDRSASGIFQLEVDGESPELARKLASVVVDNWFNFNKPQDDEKRELLWRIEKEEALSGEIKLLIDRMQKEAAQSLVSPFHGEAASAIVTLLERRVNIEADIRLLKSKLEGLSRDTVFMQPMLPTGASKPNSVQYSMIAAFGGFLLTLTVVTAAVVLGQRRTR